MDVESMLIVMSNTNVQVGHGTDEGVPVTVNCMLQSRPPKKTEQRQTHKPRCLDNLLVCCHRYCPLHHSLDRFRHSESPKRGINRGIVIILQSMVESKPSPS